MKKVLKVIFINLVIFFALILIHETVHVLIGSHFGCKQVKLVLFDMTKSPHTELACSQKSINQFLYISSLMVTVLFGSLFLFLKSKNLFLLILGFSLIFSALDLDLLFNSDLLFHIAIISGFSVMTVGEYFIALNCIDAEDILTL